jgi:hypothetical protein
MKNKIDTRFVCEQYTIVTGLTEINKNLEIGLEFSFEIILEDLAKDFKLLRILNLCTLMAKDPEASGAFAFYLSSFAPDKTRLTPSDNLFLLIQDEKTQKKLKKYFTENPKTLRR